jgi:uncharacterized protein
VPTLNAPADAARASRRAKQEPRASTRWPVRPVEAFAVVVVLVVLLRDRLVGWTDAPTLHSWATVLVSLTVQALPFVVLGTVLSAAITVYVPPSFFERALPKRAVLAVPVAGAAGAVLPACECASVPVAGALMRRGVTPAAALAFLLSSPAINPVVVAATAVAFAGQPSMVFARVGASLATSVIMGWWWLRVGRTEWLRVPARPAVPGSRVATFLASVRADVTQAGGFLAIGAITAATLTVLVPQRWLHTVGGHAVLAIVTLAVLAVVLAICSEADAFVAASLTQFSLTSRLVFLVVGPMVDVKLFAMQAGMFGRRFALRFAPVTLLVAVGVATATGLVLWGGR